MSDISPKFEIDFLTEYTDEALLEELRKIAGALPKGTALTKVTYEAQKPRVSYSTIQRRFGGWTEALAEAGLGERRRKPLSDKMKLQLGKAMTTDDVLAELKRVHAAVGTPWLTTEDFNANSPIEEGVIRRRFGTFRNGLDAAGIPSHPLAYRPVTNQDCFENLANVWTHLGRVPHYREMWEDPSRIQGKTYVTRWKTWRGALVAFVNWANEDSPPSSSSDSETVIERKERPPQIKNEQDRREVRPGLRFRVFKRDNFRCVACGRSPATHLNIELHADHIIAVANGGKTTLANLQTLCQNCNLGKGKS